MLRPRHREKSSLLWKMLGVAGGINLVLWPILIHEGVVTGIRDEVLIPVTLVSLPPSRKLPDALKIVAKTPPVVAKAPSAAAKIHPAVPVPAQMPLAHQAQEPFAPPHVPAMRMASGTPDGVAAAVLAAITSKATMHQPRPAVPPPHAPPAHLVAHQTQTPPVRLAAAKPAKAVKPSANLLPPKRVARGPSPALAARIARANALEAEGHQVAELIARQRAERVAALPALAEPTTPTVDVQETPPPTPPITEKVLLPPQKRPPPVNHDVPAVALRKAHPEVPDAMLRSSWHATFRGEFTIHSNGAATVRMVSSTGFRVLDRRAIMAARQWKFQPARRNGVAVPSIQPFSFEYDVHPTR